MRKIASNSSFEISHPRKALCLLTSLILLASPTSGAVDALLPPSIEVLPCAGAVKAELSSQMPSGSWRDITSTGALGPKFRAPTSKIGNWLEIELGSDFEISLLEISRAATVTRVFDKTCRFESKISQGINFQKQNESKRAGWFLDEDIATLVKTGSAGIIYVWSPVDQEAASYFKTIRQFARQKKLDFTAVATSESTLNDFVKVSAAYGIPAQQVRANSVEIYMRTSINRRPATLVYRGGKFADSTIYGIPSSDKLSAEIDRALSSLPKSSSIR